MPAKIFKYYHQCNLKTTIKVITESEMVLMREIKKRFYGCSDFFSSAFVRLLLRDLVAIIAVLEFNQWFTKVSTKDYKLVSTSHI